MIGGKIMKPKKTIYYDSFDFDPVGSDIVPPKIDGSYRYLREGALERLGSALLYRLVATPVAAFYSKLILREKYVGSEKLPRGSYFLFCNHTEKIGDAFSPSISQFPRRVYVVIGSKNLGIGGISSFLYSLGGIPLPDTPSAARNFRAAIEQRLKEGAVITVYPEAHLWPKYTGIRPFRAESFDLARMFDVPIYTATRTYQKDSLGTRSLIYIDGPFTYDKTLGRRCGREKLACEVREIMQARASLSNVEEIEYVRKEPKS